MVFVGVFGNWNGVFGDLDGCFGIYDSVLEKRYMREEKGSPKK